MEFEFECQLDWRSGCNYRRFGRLVTRILKKSVKSIIKGE